MIATTIRRMALESLSDDAVLSSLQDVLRDSRRVESSLIEHLAEVDARRLFARFAAPSMFVYCRDVLHLSEGEAQLRIDVARAARKHPILLTMLADGRLHLSGIAKLAPILTPENRDSLLPRAIHKTKRQIEALVAEICPRPDAPSLMRRLPERMKDSRPIESGLLLVERGPLATARDPQAVETDALPVDTDRRPGSPPAEVFPVADPASASPLIPIAVPRSISAPRPLFEPLSPGRYKVQFTAGPELREDLEALKALMRNEVPDGDLAVIVGKAVRQLRQRLEARRFAQTRARRAKRTRKDPASRYLAREVRRVVYRRGRRPLPIRRLAGPEMSRTTSSRVPPSVPVRTRRWPRGRQHLPDVPHAQPVPGRARLREGGHGSTLGIGCDRLSQESATRRDASRPRRRYFSTHSGSGSGGRIGGRLGNRETDRSMRDRQATDRRLDRPAGRE